MSVLALAMPSPAHAQSGARPVVKTVSNNALTEDLSLGTRKLTITTESTVEMEEGATVEGADIWRESLGAQAQSAILDDIAALSATAYGLSLLEAMDAAGVKTLAGLSNVTNDAQLKVSDLDDDTTMAADSASKVPSQRAVKEALSLRASLDANTFTGAQSLPTSSASSPMITFGGVNTGFYSPSASYLGFAIQGSQYVTMQEVSAGVCAINIAGVSRLALGSTGTIFGARSGSGQTLMFGTGQSLAYTLAGDSAASGASDTRGGAVTIEGGRGNGLGAGGDVVLAAQAIGISGSATQNANALQQLARWSPKPVVLTEGSATGVIRISCSNGVGNSLPCSAVVHWTVGAAQSTAHQSISGISIINFGWTAAPTITTTTTTAAVNTGTLTCTPTVVLITSGVVELRLNATSSLTQDYIRAQAAVLSAHNVSLGGAITITPQ